MIINPYLFPPPGGDVEFVTNESLGTFRNNFAGGIGFKFTVGPSNITVTQVARWVIAGHQTDQHTVRIRNDAGAELASKALTISLAPGGAFWYEALASPLVLTAGASYYILSDETAGGDFWYDDDTTLTTTSDATIQASAYEIGGGVHTNTAGLHSYGPPSFMYHL